VNIGLEMTTNGAPTPQAWKSLGFICGASMMSRDDYEFRLYLFNATEPAAIEASKWDDVPVVSEVGGTVVVRAEAFPYPSGLTFELTNGGAPDAKRIKHIGMLLRGEDPEET
jgi:hypothetical protein